MTILWSCLVNFSSWWSFPIHFWLHYGRWRLQKLLNSLFIFSGIPSLPQITISWATILDRQVHFFTVMWSGHKSCLYGAAGSCGSRAPALMLSGDPCLSVRIAIGCAETWHITLLLQSFGVDSPRLSFHEVRSSARKGFLGIYRVGEDYSDSESNRSHGDIFRFCFHSLRYIL